jgi:preprotein translocase subunit SecE
MAVASNDEGKKVIQTTLALVCGLAGFVLISFFEKMSEWFALETKVPYYFGMTQVISVLVAVVAFFYVLKNEKTSAFLTNVYQEVMKVVWPDPQQTWRHTFVIMIAVCIFGFIFGFFDFAANYLLSLVNK